MSGFRPLEAQTGKAGWSPAHTASTAEPSLVGSRGELQGLESNEAWRVVGQGAQGTQAGGQERLPWGRVRKVPFGRGTKGEARGDRRGH